MNMDSLFRRAIDSELSRWGGWLERHQDYEGYPRSDNLQGSLNGSGGGMGGHRILCLDMPTGIYATHMRVIQLPEEERYAIELVFRYQVKPVRGTTDPVYYTFGEKCKLAGIDESTIRRRWHRARYLVAGIPVPEEIAKRKNSAIAKVANLA
jgi:hypothetical protein